MAADRAEISHTEYGRAIFDLYNDLAAVLDSVRLGGALAKTLSV